ncbi:hypothetical protein N9M90_04240 [Alphaproteobacteria bacterium]|nr:hypothetical protein [Alphaproteobacteria bacterium]
MKSKLKFDLADLELTETESGILVQQDGREYLARKWKLTSQVNEIIDTAISNGFTSLWVDRHPSTSSAHYICFSRDHAKPWEFLIGGEANPPDVKCITVNKALRSPLSAISDDLIWQNFGGKHLYIESTKEKLLWIIGLIKQIPRQTLVSTRKARQLKSREVREVGFQLEKHLEDYVYELLLSKGHHVIRQPKAFKSNRAIERNSIPDLILEDEKNIFIVELKPNATDVADLHQLKRYATNKEIIARYKGKLINPVLLTGYFHKEIITEAKAFPLDFELVSYRYNDGKVMFEKVLGSGVFLQFLNC